MAVALVWVAAGSKELCCSERYQHYNHGGYVVSRIAGAKEMTKLVSQTKFKMYRERLSVKAAVDISSSNLTSENVSRTIRFPDLAGLMTDGSGRPMLSSEQKVYDVVLKQVAMVKKEGKSRLLDMKSDLVPTGTLQILNESYERCREVCAEYATIYYLGTLLMTPERQRAIWAIYATKTLSAGTVGLMSVPIMGIAPESQATTDSVYSSALALGIANQLTNILRGVGEDARRGRIYLPQDELAQSGLSDDDIFSGKVTDKWRSFMKDQIRRARMFYDDAEKRVTELEKASRWPVWASLILYRRILDAIEANDYDNFTKRACVSKVTNFMTLPVAYTRSLVRPPTIKLAPTL